MSENKLPSPRFTPPASFAGALKRVLKIDLTPSIAEHLATSIRSVAPNAELKKITSAKLKARPYGDDTLLILQDRTPRAEGLKIIRRLRRAGIETPAILIVTDDDFQCPMDLDRLSNLDVIPISELTRFALRRSLVLLGNRRERETLLEEVGDKLRTYERLLTTRDEERQRILDVATTLEARLSTTEKSFQQTESQMAEKLARADAYTTKLEQRIAELETASRQPHGDEQPHGNTVSVEPAETHGRQRDLETEIAFHRDQRDQQNQELADLRKTCDRQKRKLRQLEARQVRVDEMATRLRASEGVRNSQAQTLRVYKRRIQEIEQSLATIGALVETEGSDPDTLLERLATRLTEVDSLRSEQQNTIDRLSRSLAEQQIDSAFDKRPVGTDVVARVDEAVQRCRRLGTPLNCLMIGIDSAISLRSELGSVSYDFMQVQIAQRLQLSLRSGDMVMRYGDGEFVLITDAKNTLDARSHAERLIRDVCAAPLKVGDQNREIGISIAILAYDPEIGGAHELLRRAKAVLFEAQARGHRQILVGTQGSGVIPTPDSEAITRQISAL